MQVAQDPPFTFLKCLLSVGAQEFPCAAPHAQDLLDAKYLSHVSMKARRKRRNEHPVHPTRKSYRAPRLQRSRSKRLESMEVTILIEHQTFSLVWQITILPLLESISLALGGEFKVYLSQLIPQILRIFHYDDSEKRTSTVSTQ